MKTLRLWTISSALLASVPAWAADIYVRDIKIDGLERVEPETVLSYVDVKKNVLTMLLKDIIILLILIKKLLN